MEVSQYMLGEKIINVTSTDQSWRLIHDGTSVFALFESIGKTESIYAIELAADKQTLIDSIKSQSLVVTEEVAELYDISLD